MPVPWQQEQENERESCAGAETSASLIILMLSGYQEIQMSGIGHPLKKKPRGVFLFFFFFFYFFFFFRWAANPEIVAKYWATCVQSSTRMKPVTVRLCGAV